MNVHHGVPLRYVHLEQEVVADDPGVVDEDGRRAQLLGDPLDRGVHLGGVGDVCSHAEGFTAVAGDPLRDGAAGVLVQVEHRHRHPVRRQSRSDSGADTPGTSGDDRDSTALFGVHASPRVCG